MELSLSGRSAIVTGAGRGIGRAVSLAFARQGARLVLASRTESELVETAASCSTLGAIALPVTADVSGWESVQRLVQEAIAKLGQVDILVNSAGIYGPIGPTAAVEPDAWRRSIEVNLLGPLYLCRALMPHMMERQQGKIILLAGGGATAPLPYFSSYAASKAGVVRLADTLAEELKDFNVQVNAVSPGLVDTSLQDEVLAAGTDAGPLLAKIQQARDSGAGAVSPQIAAELAVFLASPASGRLTGKLIAAPYDPWREWAGAGDELNSTPLYTIRRLDPHTIKPLINDLP